MTLSLPPLDLLRERRLELGLPAESVRPPEARRLLLIGAAIAAALVVGAVGLALALRLQQMLLTQELQRLAPVRDQVKLLEQQMAQGKALIASRGKSNASLAGALVAVRSGSALMTDLAGRTPDALQLTAVRVGKEELQLKGRTGDPDAFERINALVLRLQGSPLIDPATVRLARAVRADTDPNSRSKGPEGSLVEFDLTAGFRESPSSTVQLQVLRGLGAAGMARRLELLRQEGLLQ